MSLQDRLASQDAFQLLTTGASLSLLTASSITGDGYNFPIMVLFPYPLVISPNLPLSALRNSSTRDAFLY